MLSTSLIIFNDHITITCQKSGEHIRKAKTQKQKLIRAESEKHTHTHTHIYIYTHTIDIDQKAKTQIFFFKHIVLKTHVEEGI
jgi:hypothetical protein